MIIEIIEITDHHLCRCNASVDAVFYAWMLQSYSRTNKYTAAIIGYVFGAGVLTTVASPNFGRLYKRQSENEGGIPGS